jgi:hypothetical protein
MTQTELKKEFKKVPLSETLTKCEVCGAMVKEVCWSYKKQKWECRNCRFGKDKE